MALGTVQMAGSQKIRLKAQAFSRK